MSKAVGVVAAWLVIVSATAARGEPAGGPVEYTRDVKPILSRRCVACHGPLTRKSGLRLDAARRLLAGGSSGEVVMPGRAGESELIERVASTEPDTRMPPPGEGEALSAEEVATLRSWIDAGAPAPKDEDEAPDPRTHWAFRPPVRPPTPVLPGHEADDPIDAFLAAGHARVGVRASGPASPEVLTRRVYLDLTGLAPTPDELQASLSDPVPGAYERLVDRLLASPRYGERWGRHWMDVWRYSDWDGYGAEVRESQPHIWHWRDWIIESLNDDLGYDRMVVAMLAADEASPGDRSALRATGYLVRNWYKFNRNAWLDHTVEHTSKAFLGLTVNCARCHDHKYDPIAQTEYYRLKAVFEPEGVRTDRLPGQPDLKRDGLPSVYDATLDAPTYLFRRGDERDPDSSRKLAPGVPAVLGAESFRVELVTLPRDVVAPGVRPFVREETLAAARAEVKAREADAEKNATAIAAARAALTAVEARAAADAARFAAPPKPEADLLARLAATAERQAAYLKAEATRSRANEALDKAQKAVKAQPNADSKAKALAAAEAALAAANQAADAGRSELLKTDGGYTSLGPVYPATSTGRRLALARWIVDRRNPLAARVAVNHVWARHFGEPLAPTVTDFGLNGKRPSHPELLDWLAVELMESGWSLKTLHRRIVTSRAYRMSSTPDDASVANRAVDPSNAYLWRQNPRRLEAEAVRDNVLYASGALDATMGGPDLDPALGETLPRRSLYFRHAKEKRVTFLKTFDSPNVTACYRRSESVVPHQALALVNSKLTLAQADALAGSLGQAIPGDGPFVEAAFVRILNRPPTSEERSTCLGYLTDEGRARSPSRARAALVHVLFNHNDFVTVR
jgi:hypothetical protein